MDTLKANRVGIEWRGVYDGVLFWYYPTTGEWAHREDNDIARGKALEMESDIERYAQSMFNRDKGES